MCRLNWNVGVVTFVGADIVKLAGLQQLEDSKCPVKHCCLKHLASHTSDQRLLHFLGTIHDVEALGDSCSMSTVIQRLLASHWPHLSLVLEWFGGIMLHVAFKVTA